MHRVSDDGESEWSQMVSRIISFFRKDADVECAEARDMASDYVDDDVEPALGRRIRSHLEKCAPCLSFFNTLRATVELLRNMERRQAPPEFRDRVKARLRDAESG